MHFLFLFLDGVGLGPDDPDSNPLAAADMPRLRALLNGQRLVAGMDRLETDRATVLPLDPNLGVDGLPQSATGQATLVTGRNIPAEIGRHYGPKPNPEVARLIESGNIFQTMNGNGRAAALLNAYPPGYFQAIQSGKRLYSAIPLAVTSAGIPLKTKEDLFAGRALSADFTGKGWHEHLDFPETPVYAPEEAGERLAELSQGYDFAFFEFWMSDYLGHHQNMSGAIEMLEGIDRVLGGLLDAWDDDRGMILLTSDHGNLEDLSTRRHTDNAVPALIVGAPELRTRFAEGLADLSHVAGAIKRLYQSPAGDSISHPPPQNQ